VIFIDPAKVAELVDPEWIAEAQRITDELREAEATRRATIIEERASHWRALKPVLAQVSHSKCWYCESLDIRSDNAVDHFRPKGRLAEDPDHGGYWWLSFTADNYRYSCMFCNSRRRDIERGTVGGKADRFPLVDDAVRASRPSDNLSAERPLLLDPCRVGDVVLLWFDDAGNTTTNPEHDRAPIRARTETSREVYHLDHGDIVLQRRRVYRDVTILAKRIDAAFAAWEGADPDARELFEELLRQLRRRVQADAEYSAVARCAVRGLRVSSGAAQALLQVL
jgi:hypothetical protein